MFGKNCNIWQKFKCVFLATGEKLKQILNLVMDFKAQKSHDNLLLKGLHFLHKIQVYDANIS